MEETSTRKANCVHLYKFIQFYLILFNSEIFKGPLDSCLECYTGLGLGVGLGIVGERGVS